MLKFSTIFSENHRFLSATSVKLCSILIFLPNNLLSYILKGYNSYHIPGKNERLKVNQIDLNLCLLTSQYTEYRLTSTKHRIKPQKASWGIGFTYIPYAPRNVKIYEVSAQ